VSSTLASVLVDITPRPLTLEEYFAVVLPEGVHSELVEGQVVVNASPVGPHQRLIVRLARVLDDACPAGYETLVAPIDWVLWRTPRATVRVPDLAVVRQEQADAAHLTEAPLLVVEVLSPDSFERDVVVKPGQYARAGLDHYWVARPDTGEIVRYGRAGDALVETGRLVSERVHAVAEPFSIELDPGTLLGRRP
jgi:Uma2 family endonuclease